VRPEPQGCCEIERLKNEGTHCGNGRGRINDAPALLAACDPSVIALGTRHGIAMEEWRELRGWKGRMRGIVRARRLSGRRAWSNIKQNLAVCVRTKPAGDTYGGGVFFPLFHWC